ncbi:hypothetical protein ACJVC5_18690 [Peredibacter sp. HCB2-198]|uniref:hypothetical protein n=1 Tax=Peredibacter sp. HCB2-198 TaxID=3383025 RepID=UPI0038B677F4
MLIKNSLIASSLLLASTISFAGPDLNVQECNYRGGIYTNGVCINASVSGHVAGVLGNDFRRGGGNETSMGDSVFQFDGQLSKDLDLEHLKVIFIDVSVIPKEEVLHYQEKGEQNFHNTDRFRADGMADRPWLLAKIGAGIELTDSQDLTLLAGSFETNGLNPLPGKPSRYYMTAPYGLIVRYDKGIQANYELKDELDRIILASFSVIDGDGIKGQSSVTPSDSRANSYPSYAGTVELHVANGLKRVFENLSPYLERHDLYVGVTGSSGETGSFAGEKRSQDDMTAYLGYLLKTGKGDAEIRVFQSTFVRNQINNGNGRHAPQVESGAYGVEVAFRGFETKSCDWEVYGNKHYFETNDLGPDGEFTWGDVRSVDGWTAGISCMNFKRISNLNIGAEYGMVNKYNEKEELTAGRQFSLVFNYKWGTKNMKKK